MTKKEARDDEGRSIEKDTHPACLSDAGLALFENHATDQNAIQHQGLRLATLPGREIGHDRDNVGNGLAIAQHAHCLSQRGHVEILLSVVAHFRECGMFHSWLKMYRIA